VNANVALLAEGVPPAEISLLLNDGVLEQHAVQAAFLSRVRSRAVQGPHYRIKQLAALDARVLAHLEGLRVAGHDAIVHARRLLGDIDAGALFTFAYHAFASQHGDSMRDAIQIACNDAKAWDGLIGALAWLDFDSLRQALVILGRSPDPDHRRICLTAYAAHRVDAASLLSRAMGDEDPLLRARALRAWGEIGGRDDLAHEVRRALTDPEPACRLWAACSLALSDDTRGAVIALDEALQGGPHDRLALEIAIRTGEPSWARKVLRSLAADRAHLRFAIVAAGALGDTSVAPWLLELMANPEFAQLAAESFATITGGDVDRSEHKQDAPPDIEDVHPEDEGLRWPNPTGLKQWWQREQARFTPGQRYLAGLTVTPENAWRVLREGYQRQRRAAAFELSRMKRGATLFAVAARADWQRRRLSL
jgi:uncharacterized protein (TIGR02270 family)